MSEFGLVRVRKLAASGAARAIRQAAGLSLAELARAAEVDKSTVWRWEMRRRRPRGAAAERYLRVLEDLQR
jgi:DNA-binding transcriptional regulator YiaG